MEKCLVDDETWPIGILRWKMQEHIQRRLNGGWKLHSWEIFNKYDTDRRVLLVFTANRND